VNRKQELQARQAKAKADFDKKCEQLEREERILKLLPDSVPLPRFIFTGSKLYGTQANLSYGESYGLGSDHYTLADALRLIDSISSEAVEIWTVKDGCLAIKPEHAITEQENERATIDGPYYGVKIRREHNDAKLTAVLNLKGEQIEVSIALKGQHQFGSFDVVSARTDTHYRGNYPEQDAKWQKRPAAIGQAKTVQYSGGSYTGPGSAGQMIYLFDCREALQGYADTLERREQERQEATA